MSNSDLRNMRKFAILTVGAIMVGLFALPLLLTPAAASTVSAISPPPNHEISGSCQVNTANCGNVVCGSNNGGKLRASLLVDVLYNKNAILGGAIEIVNPLLVPPALPNPFLYGSILSVSKVGSSFKLKGIIGSFGGIATCGKTVPELPTPFTLTGTCGFKTIVTFKANDGIKGTFTVNVACA
jgi:hypothetical protein